MIKITAIALALALAAPAMAAQSSPDVGLITDRLGTDAKLARVDPVAHVLQIVAPPHELSFGWARLVCNSLRSNSSAFNEDWTLKFWVWIPGRAKPLLAADMIGECVIGARAL
jgi:hypothetical protein